MKLTRFASGFVFCLLALAGSANADIIFGLGNGPAQKNVGDFHLTNATTAAGRVLGADLGDDVLAEADQAISIPASQNQLEPSGALFSDLLFTPIGPDWLDFEANLGRGRVDGTYTVKAIDNEGDEWVSVPFTLDFGQNRFFVHAINGQSITQVSVEASGAIINEVSQVRITAIPEPSSFVLIGLGCAGLFLFGRRRQTKLADGVNTPS